MSGIAVKFGVPVWKIVYDNQLKDKNQIVPGQALLLLEVDEGQAEESTQPELAKGKTIGGYAYPFIDTRNFRTVVSCVKRTSCIFLWFYI